MQFGLVICWTTRDTLNGHEKHARWHKLPTLANRQGQRRNGLGRQGDSTAPRLITDLVHSRCHQSQQLSQKSCPRSEGSDSIFLVNEVKLCLKAELFLCLSVTWQILLSFTKFFCVFFHCTTQEPLVWCHSVTRPEEWPTFFLCVLSLHHSRTWTSGLLGTHPTQKVLQKLASPSWFLSCLDTPSKILSPNHSITPPGLFHCYLDELYLG